MVRFKGKGLRQKGVLGRKGHLNGTSGPALKEPVGSFSTPTLSLECQEGVAGNEAVWGIKSSSPRVLVSKGWILFQEIQFRGSMKNS